MLRDIARSVHPPRLQFQIFEPTANAMQETLPAALPPLAPRGRSGVTALVAERVRRTRTPAAADSDAEDAALSQCPTRENSYGAKDPAGLQNPKPTEVPGPEDIADAVPSTKSIRASSAGSRGTTTGSPEA